MLPHETDENFGFAEADLDARILLALQAAGITGMSVKQVKGVLRELQKKGFVLGIPSGQQPQPGGRARIPD